MVEETDWPKAPSLDELTKRLAAAVCLLPDETSDEAWAIRHAMQELHSLNEQCRIWSDHYDLVREGEREAREALKMFEQGIADADYYCPDDVDEAHQVLIQVTVADLRRAQSVLRFGSQLAQTAPERLVDAWQPIETAPKDGRWLLLWNDDAIFTGHWCKYWMFVEPVEHPIVGAVRAPTHWMPVPAPPTHPTQTKDHSQ